VLHSLPSCPQCFQLPTHQVITAVLPTPCGQLLQIRKGTIPEKQHQLIYDTLGIPHGVMVPVKPGYPTQNSDENRLCPLSPQYFTAQSVEVGLAGNRSLYRDGIPIALHEGKETRLLVGLDPAARWQAHTALVRRSVAPELKGKSA
jgi:hypothetical protein